MKKTLTTLHRWLGFPLGIVFIITFATGCLTAVDELLTRVQENQESSHFIWKKTTLAEDAQAIEYFTSLHKGIRQIEMPSPENPYYRVAKKGESWSYGIDFLNAETPISGIHHKKEKGGFFDTVLGLHRNLLLGKEGLFTIGGKYYVVWTGLISLLISLLGLWLWWPRRNTFKSKDIVPRGKKRKNFYLSHMTSGVVVLIAILFLALTGASITYRDFTQQLFAIEKAPQQRIDPIKLEKSWQAWMEAAYQRMPEYATLQKIRFPRAERGGKAANPAVKMSSQGKKGAKGVNKKPDKRIEFNFIHADNWFEILRSQVFITQRKSMLVDVSLSSDLPLKDKVYALLKPLHTGHDLPIVYVIVVLLLSLIGTVMVLSGVVSFVIKKRKHKKLKVFFTKISPKKLQVST